MPDQFPPLLGIVETSLYVADLERSRSFYARLFGWKSIFSEEGRLIALGVSPGQVLLLFRQGMSVSGAGLIPGHDASGATHLAFGIEPGAASAWTSFLEERGVRIESDIPCGGNGRSIYFRDPDGNLLELVTRGCWEVF